MDGDCCPPLFPDFPVPLATAPVVGRFLGFRPTCPFFKAGRKKPNMPNRVICGECLWRSNKLAKLPESFRPEVANLIPLASVNGTFECDKRLVWSEVYAYNRPDRSVEDVGQILDACEAAKILFRWTEPDGKEWGFWIGIDKPGRLPAPSQIKGHYKPGPDVPREKLNAFLGQTGTAYAPPSPSISDASAPPIVGLGLGSGLGSGLGEGEGKGKEGDAPRPEKRPESPLAFSGLHVQITERQHRALKDAFAFLDVMAEYKKMDSWIEGNPSRRPKNSGRFAHNWLSRIKQSPKQRYEYHEDGSKFDDLPTI